MLSFRSLFLFAFLLKTTCIFSSSNDPSIAMDSSGNTLALWQENSANNTMSIQTATLVDCRTSWTSPQTLSLSGENVKNPYLAMNSVGDAVAVWIFTDIKMQCNYLHASIYHKGSWTKRVQISKANQLILTNFKVTINELSNILVIWNCYPTPSSLTQLYSASADATVGNSSWGVPVAVSIGENSNED